MSYAPWPTLSILPCLPPSVSTTKKLLTSRRPRCLMSKLGNIAEAYSKPSWFRNKKHTDEQLLRRLQLWGLKQLAVGHPWRLLLLPVVVVLRPPRMSFTLCSLLPSSSEWKEAQAR